MVREKLGGKIEECILWANLGVSMKNGTKKDEMEKVEPKKGNETAKKKEQYRKQ